MRKNNTICAIMIIIGCLFFSAAICTLASHDDQRVPNWKTGITSEIEKERVSARQVALDNRKDTIEYLRSVLNSPTEERENFFTSTTSRNVAIFLLGKLRAKEAVNDLMKWLSPKAGQGTTIWALPILTPAGYALVEIGLPSVPPLVDLLKSGATGRVIDLRDQSIKIIVAIKGLAETELLFEDALAKEADPTKKENLKLSLDFLKDPRFRKILQRVYNEVNRLE